MERGEIENERDESSREDLTSQEELQAAQAAMMRTSTPERRMNDEEEKDLARKVMNDPSSLPMTQGTADQLIYMIQGFLRYSRDRDEKMDAERQQILAFMSRQEAKEAPAANVRQQQQPSVKPKQPTEMKKDEEVRQGSMPMISQPGDHMQWRDYAAIAPDRQQEETVGKTERISTKHLSDEQFREFVETHMAAQQAHNAVMSRTMAMMAQMMDRPRSNKAVPPMKYSSDRDQDLTVFFREFEEYSNTIYPSRRQDWQRLLGSYLEEGAYLDLYHQLHKADKSYEEVKEGLIGLFNNESTIKKERAVTNYMTATMKKKENVRVFAMRLEELAVKAYPSTAVEELREHETMRQIFLRALPSTVQNEITKFLNNHEWLEGKKISFDKLINLADRHYKEMKTQQPSVAPEVVEIAQVRAGSQEKDPQAKSWTEVLKSWGNKEPKEQKAKSNSPTSQSKKTKSKNRTNSDKKRLNERADSRKRPSGNTDRRDNGGRSTEYRRGENQRGYGGNRRRESSPNRNDDRWCTFCDKGGHTVQMCYVFNNICAICKGEGHLSYQCPRNSPRRQFKGNCPVCKKSGHAGKDCSQWTNTNPRRESRSPPNAQSGQRTAHTSRRQSTSRRSSVAEGAVGRQALN